MKRIILVCMLGLLVSNFVMAAEKASKAEGADMMYTLNGYISDQDTGEALAGVKVHIPGTESVAYTDFEGNFSLTSQLADAFTMHISMISYKELSVPLTLDTCISEEKIRIEIAQVDI